MLAHRTMLEDRIERITEEVAKARELTKQALMQSADTAAQSISERGYYVEDGRADPAVLASLVADAGRAGIRLVPVALSTRPASGTTAFADAILDRIRDGTSSSSPRRSLDTRAASCLHSN